MGSIRAEGGKSGIRNSIDMGFSRECNAREAREGAFPNETAHRFAHNSVLDAACCYGYGRYPVFQRSLQWHHRRLDQLTLASPLATRSPRQLTPLSQVLTSLLGCLERSEEHTSELQSLRHLVCR